VKAKLREIEPSIPKGLKIIPVYDRSDLILRAIATLKEKLIEVSLVVSVITLWFLFHLRSALVVILLLPVAILLSFVAMFFASAVSITLGPLLMVLFIRGRIHAEEHNPLNWLLVRAYRPLAHGVLRLRWLVLSLAIGGLFWTIPLFSQLGSEFMPPLNEGTILYMPTALPGISIKKATEVLQAQDRLLKKFPEVDRVLGKMGRASTPTDPAPLSMAETVVTLKPQNQWRPGMTWDRLIDEMDKKVRFPGMPNIWWMPIQTRTEMLATGIRTSLGILIYGPDLKKIEEIGVLMVVYLDQAVEQQRTERHLETLSDLREAIVDGASRRVRPIVMTASAVIFGLLPIMWSTGTGADVMQRIAAP